MWDPLCSGLKKTSDAGKVAELSGEEVTAKQLMLARSLR
jgi:hypothetical protein